jgi:hypothetical protein
MVRRIKNMRNFRKDFLISGMLVAAIIAIGALESAYAAPLAPILGKPVKVFSGNPHAPGAKILATDGVKFYTAYIAVEGGDGVLKLASGSNNGEKWDTTSTVTKRGAGVLDEQVSVAVSNDVTSPSRKIVHVVWNQGSDTKAGLTAGLYYSWASDADLHTWSAPIRINGLIPDVRAISIVASKAGELHVVFMSNDRKIYLTYAASTKAAFANPTLVPGTPMDDDRAVDVALDSSNNLHIGFAFSDDTGKIGVKYIQKLAKKGIWTPPIVVIPSTAVNFTGYLAIAASDANNIHIASTVIDEAALDVFSSSDGGRSWTKRTVTTDKTTAHGSIVSSPDKALTVGVAFTNAKTGAVESRIFRSTDGATWSAAAIIPNETSVNLAIDDKGKVGVLTYDANQPDDYQLHSFSKER